MNSCIYAPLVNSLISSFNPWASSMFLTLIPFHRLDPVGHRTGKPIYAARVGGGRDEQEFPLRGTYWVPGRGTAWTLHTPWMHAPDMPLASYFSRPRPTGLSVL